MLEKKSWKVQKTEIGLRIIRTRKAKQLSQGGLAKLLTIASATLSRIEKGVVTMPIDTLVRLCSILDVTADWLLVGDGTDEVAESIRLSMFRRCAGCEETKPIDSFGPTGGKRVCSYCRECSRLYMRKRRKLLKQNKTRRSS